MLMIWCEVGFAFFAVFSVRFLTVFGFCGFAVLNTNFEPFILFLLFLSKVQPVRSFSILVFQ